MKTTVYLAAPYQSRELIQSYRDEVLEPNGITVTSRWLDEGYSVNTQPGDLTPAVCQGIASLDIEDIMSAHHFVTFSTNGNPGIVENSRGGRHFELGFAHAHKRVCWIVGDGNRQHMFEYLIPEQRIASDVHNLLDRLEHHYMVLSSWQSGV